MLAYPSAAERAVSPYPPGVHRLALVYPSVVERVR